LLQRIEEIAISSFTELNQVAQNIVDVSAKSGEFKDVSLYLYEKEKNLLRLFACSRLGVAKDVEGILGRSVCPESIKLGDGPNLISEAYATKKMQVAKDLKSLLGDYISDEELNKLRDKELVKCVFVYPLVVRSGTIGVLLIGVDEREENLSGFHKELLDRLVNLIGIAMDNALLYQDIKVANKKLTELDRAKDEFFSIASHELRTPLTAIQGNTSMIMDYYGEEIGNLNMREMLSDIHESTRRLIKLVNEFLDMSRLEQGKIKFDFNNVDIVKLIRDLIKEHQSLAESKHLELTYEGPDNLEVYCDSDRTLQVAINLVGNSMKHTENGGITVKLERDGRFAKISVIDTGPGISKENQAYLFQKFRQTNSNIYTREVSQGTGLGLYISRLMIEGMSGSVWLENSEVGKGSTFVFKVPLAKRV